jgi:hypothetical protein
LNNFLQQSGGRARAGVDPAAVSQGSGVRSAGGWGAKLAFVYGTGGAAAGVDARDRTIGRDLLGDLLLDRISCS